MFDEEFALQRTPTTGRSGMSYHAHVALDEFMIDGMVGCRVIWEGSANAKASIDATRFIERMETWAEDSEATNRFATLERCANEDFDWSLTLDNMFPRKPHLRLGMFHKEDIDFLVLVASETPTRERGDGC
ncbi:MAG: hypothetical protein AAFU55_09270 [Pseudomonadota bacterium]